MIILKQILEGIVLFIDLIFHYNRGKVGFFLEILMSLFAQMHQTATCKCDDTRGCVIQFLPPDDEYMCSKHVEVRNKPIVK